MEKLNVWKLGLLGFQHMIVMYAGAVIVPLVVGPAIGLTSVQIAYLISADLFTAGVASLIQAIGGRYVGNKLPVMLGCSFTAVSPMIMIGTSQGIGAIYGAVIASGIIVMILASFMSKVVKYFPPIVTGTVVMLIGLTLIPVAINTAAGGIDSPTYGHPLNLFLVGITLAGILTINRFFNGYMKAVSVLISVLGATIIANLFGIANYSTVEQAPWIHVPQPFYFAYPTFYIPAIIVMALVSIVSMVESMGVFIAASGVCEKKIGPQDIKKGLRAEGLTVTLGGIFNTFPYTTFSQNVGLLALTGVKTRNVTIAAGIILITLSFFPKFGAMTTSIPSPVLGGAMLAMFGMNVASGIRMMAKTDFSKNENLIVVGLSVGLGLGVTVAPKIFVSFPEGARLILENGIVMGSLTAIVLNLFLNGTKGIQETQKEEEHDNGIVPEQVRA